MRPFLQKIRRTFFSRKFVSFCLLGIVNTFDVAWMSALYDLIFQSNVSATLGYLSSLALAYVLSSRFIFHGQMTKRGLLRFFISYIPNFLIYFLVTFVTINTLHLPLFWASTLAVMAGGPITFVIIKFYAFQPPGTPRHHLHKHLRETMDDGDEISEMEDF